MDSVLPGRVRLPLQRTIQGPAVDVPQPLGEGREMSAEKAIQRIHLAVKGRKDAAEARKRATEELAQAIREAQKEGVAVTQIASEAGLSRQAVYDLLGEQPFP